MTQFKIALLTALSLLAFAANSLFSRLALQSDTIGAAEFTAIRLISGALCLAVLLNFLPLPRGSTRPPLYKVGSNLGALMLFIYAVCFSYAYLFLDTGSGALILFAAVQLTVLGTGYYFGQRFSRYEWLGLIVAFCGLIFFVWPTLSTPSFSGSLLMLLAGCAWGIYTWMGKQTTQPLTDTAGNFIRSLLFLIPLFLWVALTQADEFNLKIELGQGLVWAVLSGALASGLGYSLWYQVLPKLSTLHAALLQLLVPPLAALGGVMWLNEPFTMHLAFSSLLILGGIALTVIKKTSINY